MDFICVLYCEVICQVVLFCKQKTAYDMRISDWSSDVCSADLVFEVGQIVHRPRAAAERAMIHARDHEEAEEWIGRRLSAHGRARGLVIIDRNPGRDEMVVPAMIEDQLAAGVAKTAQIGIGRRQQRSEENTSELQSLMSSSYAVLCLKKK